MALNRRLKVLVSAYACSPFRGSEPGVGWGVVSALARYHDLLVLVEEEEFRADIERWLTENPGSDLEAVQFFFIRKQRNRYLHKFWPPSYYWYYRRWHYGAFKLAQKLHAEIGLDLAHQLTMVGFREPGYLWKLGISFVWGPIGGMGFFPWCFLPVVGLHGAIYYLGYNLFNWLHIRFLSRPKRAAQAAAAGPSGLIAATPENRDGALKYWGCQSMILTEVGLPCNPVSEVRAKVDGEPLRLVWAGQHTPGKALNLGLYALSRLPNDVTWELHILGEGRQTLTWQRLAQKLNIAGRCFFYGWVSRNQALNIMNNSHVMLITSLRDLTSTVTVEALAFGLPIICLDHCGFSEVVNEACGLKIPVTTPQEVIAKIALAIEHLNRDEKERQKLAQGALRCAQDYNWQKKAETITHIYRQKLRLCE